MNILFRILVALVILSPLAIGAVYMWTWSMIGIIIACLLVVWAGVLLWGGEAPAVSARKLWPVLALFAAVLAWAMVQIIALTPEAWHHPLWSNTGEVLGVEILGAISLNPFEGGSAILRLLSYGGVFWLALQLCRDRQRARIALTAMAISGAIYALYGIVVEISGTNTILWFRKTSYTDLVTSTFVNRNTFATFTGLGLIATTACLVKLFEERIPAGGSRRYAVHSALRLAFTKGWYLLSGWMLLIVALLMSQSRGGFLSVLVGLITLFIALNLRATAPRRMGRVIGMSIALAGLVFIAISGSNLLDRLSATDVGSDARPSIYAGTSRAIMDAPVLGTGYGTFKDTYRMYRTADIRKTLARAHNTYLENALELGIPAAAALFLVVAAVGGYCAAGILHRRRDAIYPCVGVAAISLVGAHSLFDFSLQIPAVALTFCFLLGLGCAHSWSTRDS